MYKIIPAKDTLSKIGVVTLGFIATVIWMETTWFLLMACGVIPNNPMPHVNYFTIGFFVSALFSDLWAPLWEEWIFRKSAIAIGLLNDKILWPVIFISSCLFGWGHGHGPYSILMQGGMGVILAIVYLKNGCSYWSAVAVHIMWNLAVDFNLARI